MKTLLSLYNLRLPLYFIYMLQQVEYEPAKFYDWFVRLARANKSIHTVMSRQQLVFTRRAKMLLVATYMFAVVWTVFYVVLVTQSQPFWLTALFGLFALPTIIFCFMWVLAYVGYRFVIVPQQNMLVSRAAKIFSEHKGVKIAVLGSYGKTTMKELLSTVLSEQKNVASTPGNMNVSVSHARFAAKLKGDEDVLVVEFGEGAPGDIARMAKMLQPDYAVVTGLAPNHLDHYASVDDIAADLLSIYDYVAPENIFVSGESHLLQSYLKDNANLFTVKGAMGWVVEEIQVSVASLTFDMKAGKKKIHAETKLLGRHQVAPISFVASFADRLGMSGEEIERGLARTVPYDHRMQPRSVNGAWLIDDTYNGNLEGVQAGLRFLGELEADRRWYVTPGLVDQGTETERVHKLLGEAILDAQPDIVVLMDNSVRPIIEKTLLEGKFRGELRIVQNPLDFYTTIEHHVAKGDVVLMQNDWTDNYT